MSLPIGPTSLDWPAWIQAIGSVAGVLIVAATYFLDRRESRLEKAEARRLASELEARRNLAFESLTESVLDAVRSVERPLYELSVMSIMPEATDEDLRPKLTRARSTLRHAADQLDGFLAFGAPSAEAASVAATFRGELRGLCRQIDDLSHRSGKELIDGMRDAARQAHQRLIEVTERSHREAGAEA